METWKESLIHFFEKGIKQQHSDRLGVEVEHFIVTGGPDSRRAVAYSGEAGIRRILERLMAQYPDAVPLHDDDFFGFTVPEFAITLEPAAQLEISIAPMSDIHQIGRVYSSFVDTLSPILRDYGHEIVYAGGQPYTRVSDLELIPKRRYDLMNAHFKKTGTGGMQMMRGTASLQVSIDYLSEEDFRRKIQAAYYYGPLFKLLCDNTVQFEGAPVTGHLKRTDIWRRVDPARCGILPDIFSDSYGFGTYADFIGSVQPIFLKYGDEVLPTGHQTVAEIFAGRQLDETEAAHVLSMVFPDVRLKQFIEIRFADSVPQPRTLAYCALIKGLLYREDGILCAQDRIRSRHLTADDIRRAEDALMADGLTANLWGQPVREYAKSILELAEKGLPAGERPLLTPFYDIIQ
ncbi:MAG: hypothetical protein IJG52_06890 [Lachnospiraceae bacterium]|nr:hypothetical protein [Lachnospiraceae bacterium]